MNWREKLALARIYPARYSFKEATYMVVGVDPMTDAYGIITYTDNEFMAYRIRKAVADDGGQDVKVLPYNPQAVKKVEQEIEVHFFNKTR